MTNTALANFLEDVTKLEKVFPGITKDKPELKQTAVQILLSSGEPLVALPGPKTTPALADPDQTTSINVDDDELVDLHGYWNQTYRGEMVRKGTLQDACKNAYTGKYGGLPSQQDFDIPTPFGSLKQPVYVYPRTWLAEFLETFRISFPIHWSKVTN
jgi:hypothetical protein